MSESDPIWMLDAHPELQWDMNLRQAYEDGWRTLILKISEGPYRDGTYLRMPSLKEFYKRAKDAGFRIAFYAYLVESFAGNPAKSGRANAEHFLNRAEYLGGVDGHILVGDFESYNAPYSYLSPSNGCLEAFNEYVDGRVDRDHPRVIYSTHSYWTGGQPSGNVETYGTRLTWDAELASAEPAIARPKAYYHSMEHWGWRSRPWGGPNANLIWWQYCWSGNVGNVNMDCDASRQSKAEDDELWKRSA